MMQTTNICISQRISYLFLVMCTGLFVDANAQKYSNFTCKNKEKEINFVQTCDGVPDCGDGSDEKHCENEAVLFYYSYERELRQSCDGVPLCKVEGFETLNVTGIYLNSEKEFTVAAFVNKLVPPARTLDSPAFASEFQILSYGPQFDVFCVKKSVATWLRMNRTDSLVKAGSWVPEAPSTEVVYDWVMAKVYYIPSSGQGRPPVDPPRIKICHSGLEICIPLRSKYNLNPTRLTIAPERRLLFWIVLNSEQNTYSLYRYTLDVSPKTKSISQGDMFALPCMTIDPTRDLIYWMESHPSFPNIIVSSITFDGENQKVIELPDTNHLNPSGPLSFVVFDNTIYWMDSIEYKIRKCSVDGCSNPTIYRQISTPSNANSNMTRGEVGSLTIDHRSPLLNKTGQDICSNSSCSHLCLLNSDVVYDCYCESSEKPLPSYPARRNGYCEGSTLIATYGNHLYVVGLPHSINGKPIIRKNAINISSISTVIYNPITGNVILAEMDRQNIYSWVPRTGELGVILEEGPGTISSIEFDPHSNNLYWIDPTNLTINEMNLVTRSKITLVNGNSSYYPTKLTLNLVERYIFVMFVRDGEYNPHITVERISMNGDSTSREIVHEDSETVNSETVVSQKNHSLHYENELQLLCLLDADLNKIICANTSDENSDSLLISPRNGGTIKDVTSLEGIIVWSEDDLKIRILHAHHETYPMSLGLKRHENAVLTIAPVVSWTANGELPSAKFPQNKSGCEELCWTCYSCTAGKANTQHIGKTNQGHSTSTLILNIVAATVVGVLLGLILDYVIYRKSFSLRNFWPVVRRTYSRFSNPRTTESTPGEGNNESLPTLGRPIVPVEGVENAAIPECESNL